LLMIRDITSTFTLYVVLLSKCGLIMMELVCVATPTGAEESPVTGVEFGWSLSFSLLAAASVMKLTDDPLSRNARHWKSSPYGNVTSTEAVASRAACTECDALVCPLITG